MKKNLNSSLTDKALAALQAAVAKVIQDHRQRGRPLAVWRNGKAAWISAETAGVLSETPPACRAKPPRAKT
jgi:hypothetical protein